MNDQCWTVFAQSADVYTRPDVKSDKIGSLRESEEVHGELMTGPEKEIEWLKVRLDGGEGYVLRCYLMRVHPHNLKAKDLPFGEEVVNRWWGLPLEYEPSDLVAVPDAWGYEADREYFLRREVRDAVVKMLEAARSEGAEIRVASDYRSGKRQREIYLRAVEKDGPEQRYSAPPGHSEHQLGTTADFCDPEGKHLFSQTYDETPGGDWLAKNAPRFGFRRSYFPHNVKETGYISEPWHWRFVGKNEG